ncbi:expressed unknown protein [Seminavis robusta]|uniref:Uncharacterized protein n=1 Tax=Seminavis robusta TaxID=568900 RepID=A0A9N8DEL2_9STRA|nr:expressed unknown protein [Seminavis robusta]|eukprot:Sro34_g022070.1 n/a (237) ;mRNA; r:121645-122355
MGNNHAGDLTQWQELPCRKGYQPTFWKRVKAVASRHRRLPGTKTNARPRRQHRSQETHKEARLTKEDIKCGPWDTNELQVLMEAGSKGMKRVGNQVLGVFDEITKLAPQHRSLASSGVFEVDPQLCVPSLDLELTLPLEASALEKIVRVFYSTRSSLGVNGNRRIDLSRRNSYALDIGSEAQLSNPAFLGYVQSLLSTATEALTCTPRDALLGFANPYLDPGKLEDVTLSIRLTSS